jgi:hypothetical protein
LGGVVQWDWPREVKRPRRWMAAWMAAAALGIYQAGCLGVLK